MAHSTFNSGTVTPIPSDLNADKSRLVTPEPECRKVLGLESTVRNFGQNGSVSQKTTDFGDNSKRPYADLLQAHASGINSEKATTNKELHYQYHTPEAKRQRSSSSYPFPSVSSTNLTRANQGDSIWAPPSNNMKATDNYHRGVGDRRQAPARQWEQHFYHSPIPNNREVVCCNQHDVELDQFEKAVHRISVDINELFQQVRRLRGAHHYL
jgi:hypothetical protein